MRTRLRVAVLTAALISQGALLSPASAAEGPRHETIADGLDNPRGIDVAADGTVYVAEAGPGGDEHCTTTEMQGESIEICMGATATVSSVDADGTVTEVVTGIPSYMGGEGEFVGASDVVVADDGVLYISVGLGGNTDLRDAVAADWEPAAMLGTVQRYEDGTLSLVADLAQWEADNDPNEGQPSTEGPMGGNSNDSNPHGLLLTADGMLLATDAGGNTVLEIDPDTGDITLAAFLEDRMVEAPAFLGAPPGTMIPMQAVPTGIAADADGTVAIGQLTGFPFPVGGANVYDLDDLSTIAEGFTNIMDVTYRDGELYVLEIAHNSLLSGLQGALVRVRDDGTHIALLRDTLMAPGGVATGPDGMLYITNNSVGAPGSGSVVRFDPSQAADPGIQSACPPLEVPGTSLSDVADGTHEEAITCAVWHGLFAGFADGTFRPVGDITRGQMATTVARLIRATGAELPAGDDGQFPDVDGTIHAEAINALATAGLVAGFADGTYQPQSEITRAQAVTILVGAYEYATDMELAAGSDAFDDDDGTHEANIDAAASMGWVQGTAPRTFSPGDDVRRGQMASILARMAADLVDAGSLVLPS